MDAPRIALMTTWMTFAFSRSVWYSLQDAARTRGVRLTAIQGGPLDRPRGPNPSSRVYNLVDPTNFDGVVVFTGPLGNNSTPEATAEFVRGLPVPTVSLGVDVAGVTSVSLDQGRAIVEVVRHLHDVHGFRRFAFVEGPRGPIEAQERRRAFFQALDELGVPPSQVQTFPGDYLRGAGAAALRALVEGTTPVALVCANDLEAEGALLEAQALGVAVPSQVAITGFDDLAPSRLLDPSLTTVSQPLLEQATRALDLVLARIEGRVEPSAPQPARVIYRESCGCVPRMAPFQPADKVELVRGLLDVVVDSTEGFLSFCHEWITDFLTAFEYLLETGNASVLRVLWDRYQLHPAHDHERGFSFRRLFLGLEALYGSHPRFEVSLRENLLLAGGSEAKRAQFVDDRARTFSYRIHAIEMALGAVTTRQGLAQLSDPGWRDLGILGVVLVRLGSPGRVIYHHTPWVDLPGGLTVEAPHLLPPELDTDLQAHRVVAALTVDAGYLGYAVFWTEGIEGHACDLLANYLGLVVQRLELLERLQEQSRSLAASLDESRRVQEQLVETEKVASLGRLVAGVAHEINTPLGTGITGTSFLLERLTEVQTQFRGGSLTRSTLDQFLLQGNDALSGVLSNLQKAAELIQAFKGLGLDHGQGEWRQVNLRSLFTDLGTVYEGELAKRGVVLRTELPPAEIGVLSQPAALVQVVGELLENALLHAFPPRTLHPQVLLQVQVADGHLRLVVTDNGRGMGPEERRHLFDPLFTTQRPQGHAGLGLHLAFQLVTRTLGGRMTVASQPGEGSCFLCLIPLSTPEGNR